MISSLRGIRGGRAVVCGREEGQGRELTRARGLASRAASAATGGYGGGTVLGRGERELLGEPWLAGGARFGSRGAADTRRGEGGPGRARGDAGERERVAAWPRRAQELLPRDHDDNLAQIGPSPCSLGLR